MIRPILLSLAFLAVPTSGAAGEPAGTVEPAEDILARVLAAKPCAAFETAQGWIIQRRSPQSDLIGAVSDQITAVDRSRRRFVSMVRQTKSGDDAAWRVTRYAYADGRFFACSAEHAETCRLEPLPQEQVPPEDITTAWIGLGDLRAPDRGGAEIASATVPPEVTGAVAAVSLKPQGGRPYVLYVAANGDVVATDMTSPDQTVRTWLSDYETLGGCETPTTMRVEILPGRAGRYLEWHVVDFDYRPVMSPDDTRFE